MIEESRDTSLNLVGLLAGLMTVPVILSLTAGAIWLLWTLITLFSPWIEML